MKLRFKIAPVVLFSAMTCQFADASMCAKTLDFIYPQAQSDLPGDAEPKFFAGLADARAKGLPQDGVYVLYHLVATTLEGKSREDRLTLVRRREEAWRKLFNNASVPPSRVMSLIQSDEEYEHLATQSTHGSAYILIQYGCVGVNGEV